MNEDVAFTDQAYLVRKPSGSWAVSAYDGAARWRVREFESREEAILWTASKGVWHLLEAVGLKGAEQA